MRRAVLPQHHVLSFPFPARDVVRMGRALWTGTPLADEDDSLVAYAMAATGGRRPVRPRPASMPLRRA